MKYLYSNPERNHIIIKGREEVFRNFIDSDYNGMKHKVRNSISPNSEDALTWSCFEALSHLPLDLKIAALDEILEDSYEGKCNFSFSANKYSEKEIQIFVGKKYSVEINKKESTEVDASIELPDKLIFIEAKLYSSISLADEKKSHDQIARKLRVGLGCEECKNREFYFIFLDIAPPDMLLKYTREKKSKENALNKSPKKWKSAWWFKYYKYGRRKSLKPLTESLNGIKVESIEKVSENMGWLTWSDLYKNILRGLIKYLQQVKETN
ncbi:hypothetical protein [Flavobacterium caeni]|uniref:Uncharacterized protein n=1 Tax=Flavobacterium caeni TaxID=490189 RepID=A0A1G5KJA9_9FLAO|nr:hypothetical protein [Flavobacterium caeni]SCZ00636.1 hypothetical protein SAMN02927903_03338 [Flavobacterium caeni]